MSWCIVALGAKGQLVSILRAGNKELTEGLTTIWEMGPDFTGDPPEPILWFGSLTEAEEFSDQVGPPDKTDLRRNDGSDPPKEALSVTAVSNAELDRLLIEQELERD